MSRTEQQKRVLFYKYYLKNMSYFIFKHDIFFNFSFNNQQKKQSSLLILMMFVL